MTPVPPPTLDRRAFQKLLDEVTRRVREAVPEWRPPEGDASLAVAAVYAHYLELVLDRLNRVPDKHLLAFLDLLGIGLLPPGAARVPAVFSPTPAAGASTRVPSGTRIATVQTETDPAVVYETEQDLTVVAARLVAGFTVEPDADRYGDRTPMVSGQDPAAFAAFRGERPIDHLLHLGMDPLLSLLQGGTLRLRFQLRAPAGAGRLDRLLDPVVWEVFRAGGWRRLPAPTIPPPEATTGALTLHFDAFPGADPTALAGPGLAGPRTSRWIRGRLRFPATDVVKITAVDDGDTVQVLPSLMVPHVTGAPVTKLDVSRDPVTEITVGTVVDGARGVIEVKSGRGLRRDDLVMVDTGNQIEFVTLGEVPEGPGPVTIPITPNLRLSHNHNCPVRRVTVPPRPVATTLAAETAAGATSLALASDVALAPGDVVRVGNPAAGNRRAVAPVEAITAEVEVEEASPIPPEAVHVNTTPVDVTRDFLALGPNPQPGDTLWLASAEAFSKTERTSLLPDGGLVRVAVRLDLGDPEVQWEYLLERTWERVDKPRGPASLNESGTLELVSTRKPTPVTVKIGEVARRLVFYRATMRAGTFRRVPWLRAFQLEIAGRRVDPVLAFTSEVPVDLVGADLSVPTSPAGIERIDPRAEFCPFGPNPREGSTFYVGFSEDVGTTVGFNVLLAHNARLRWEYLSPTGWTRLGESSTGEQSIQPVEHEFVDGTLALTRSSAVLFRRPAEMAAGEVNGTLNHWIRASLVSGGYGRAVELIPADPADPAKGFRLRQGTGALNPPVVSSIRLSYRAGSSSPLVVTQTLLRLADRTVENRSGGPYPPFEPVEDTEPTFYLGLDPALPNDAINLYVTVPPRGHTERLTPAGPAASSGGGSTLAWEYWNGRRWAELAVFDGTGALTEPGIIQFIGPTDLEAAALFDQDPPRRWIRARLLDARAADPHLLGGVFLNAVDAVQAATVRGEVLGTSNSSPGQRLRLSRTPVLAGQRILVREPERPPQPEEAELGLEEGPDAVREAAGGQVWVRWHEVRSLVASSPRSRHYTLDRHSGEVRFGDGSHGLVPPFAGPGGIVAEVYRAGGGAAGNRPTGAVSRLTTSNPLLAGVTNPAPAAGGSAAETLAGVRERGPQSLRHRDRAVTPEDFEWLARQASGTSVARARCLPNRNRELEPEPGWVTVIVVPEGTDNKLLPSVELVRTVEDQLARRSLATLGVPVPSRVNVVGPGYVPVELELAVRPSEPARSDPARKAVLAALDRFLHPLSGGPDGDGWVFGRDVFLSEVFAVLEALPDVEHVHQLAFRPTVATVPLVLAEPHEPAPATYPAGTVVEAVTGGGLAVNSSGLSAVLAEPIPEGTPVAAAMIVVFQEGERVRVGAGPDAVEAVVSSISGATLSVEPFRSDAEYPPGAPVTALASGAGSVLTASVAEGTLVTRLQVRGFLAGDRLRFPVEPGGTPNVAELATNGEERLLLGSRLRVPPFALVHSGAQLTGISQR